MHQVLSYETAVRANSARDIREYVTKRTCVSLVLTIAFFTLISGYLLGKFVADRQHHIRHHGGFNVNHQGNSNNNNSNNNKNNSNLTTLLTNSEYLSLKQIRAFNHGKQELLQSARTLSQRMAMANSQSSLNTQIFNRYISCNQDIPPTTNISTSEFIQQMVDRSTAKQRECLDAIGAVIDENMGNG